MIVKPILTSSRALLQSTMVGIDGERFKMIRRNSLRNEVDGSFEELEEFEDRNEVTSESRTRQAGGSCECNLYHRGCK